MKTTLVLVFVLAFAAFAAAELHVLTSDTFEDSVAEGVWLVKFYAPWCGHCKRLAPTWDELAEKDLKWNVAKVDCTEHKDICTSNGVRGYPTLLLFKDGGEGVKYQGQRNIPDFIKFVENKHPEVASGEGAAEAEAEEEVENNSDVVTLTDSNFDQARSGVWLVEFFAPWCGHCKRLAPTWEELGTKAKGQYNVGAVDVTEEKALAKEFGIRSMPTIKLLVDGQVTDYSGARTVDAFDQFVKAKTGGDDEAEAEEEGSDELTFDEGVGVLTVKNFDAQTEGKDAFVKFYAPWCGHCKRLAPTWAELAQKNEDKFIAKVDCTTDRDACSKFEVRGFPTLILLKADGSHVKYSGARTVDAFESFLEENL